MSFDEYAKHWDTDFRIKRAKTIAKEIEKVLERTENYIAMEFGCGTGLISFNLVDRFNKLTLVDSSKGMIDIVKAKIEQYEAKNIVGIELDLSKNETLDDRFDVIYSSMVLHHVQDIPQIINALKALMNVEGYLVIIDLNEEDGRFHNDFPDFDGHHGFNQENLKMILSDAGFADIESHTFYNDVRRSGDEAIEYSLFIMKARLT